jgi:hypothetical protein
MTLTAVLEKLTRAVGAHNLAKDLERLNTRVHFRLIANWAERGVCADQVVIVILDGTHHTFSRFFAGALRAVMNSPDF